MINLSIILPTINESENLVDLIPEIIDELKITNILNYEILVIDDGSTDNTESVINKIRSYNDNVQLIKRKQQPSLPKSIYLGLELSKYEYTMWLDADGSMPAKDLGKLIVKQIEYPNSVIIGSRFVEGGGYKGSSLESDNNLFKSIYRIYNSEDSILATALSKLFNNLLSKLSSSKVIDMTSGFIIGKKQYFSKYCFEKAIYGEYFVKLIKDLQRKDIHCIEVGYICLTRKKGESKTSTNYFQLLKMGLPYIKEAYNLRNLDAKIKDSADNLLAIILRFDDDFKTGKNFFTKDNYEMQLATFNLPKDTIIDSHIHLEQKRIINSTSEVIAVMNGQIQISIYDEENLITQEVLSSGDISVLYRGGHGIKVLEDSKFFESKQGPYFENKDKVKF